MGRSAQRRDRRPAPVAPATLSIDALQADPENRRRHPERNLAMITAALRDVGAARSIVIDETNRVLAGNGVLAAAPAAGLSSIRVIDAAGDELIAVRRSGLTPDQKRALAIYDNRTAELAEWNLEQLALDQAADLDLRPFWTAAEEAALFAGHDPDLKAGLTDPDDVPPARATTIQVGDVFALGPHRLACGSATDAGLVERLLGDVRPQLMVTDPPYGVNYNPRWRRDRGLSKPHNVRAEGTVDNDNRADWRDAWALFPGDVAYVWHAALHADTAYAALVAANYEIRSQIIWAKPNLVIGRGHYHWQHEPCWYAVRTSRTGHWAGDRKQSTVWAIPNMHRTQGDVDDGKNEHSTQKPVECMRRPITNNSSPGQAVYDPFVGSGTTIIAAEQTARVCYAIELNPSYVQLTIDRWEAFTGQQAVATAATR